MRQPSSPAWPASSVPRSFAQSHARARRRATGSRHLLLRDTCYEAMAKERRATLHEAWAGCLLSRGEGRAEGLEAILGSHLEQAARYRRGFGGRPEDQARLAAEAGAWLERAGRAAVRRHDPDAATSLLARAIDLLPRGAARLEASLQLAEARRQGGDLPGARALLDAVADGAAGAGAPALAVRARVLRAWLDGRGSVADVKLEPAPDDETLSLVWGLRLDRAFDAGRMADAREAAEAVIRHAAAAGDPWLVARAGPRGPGRSGRGRHTPVPDAIDLCRTTLEAAGHDGASRRRCWAPWLGWGPWLATSTPHGGTPQTRGHGSGPWALPAGLRRGGVGVGRGCRRRSRSCRGRVPACGWAGPRGRRWPRSRCG